MIKEAIEHIQNTFQKAELPVIDGRQYLIAPSHVEIGLIKPPYPEALEVSTLTGIVDYLEAIPDNKGAASYVQIVDFNHVKLIGALDKVYRNREVYLSARPPSSNLSTGRFLDIEQFMVLLMGSFVQTNDLKNLLHFLGSVQREDSVRQDDDGVTQKVTVKRGITSLTEARVPNPITLQPYVTFPEIDQPGIDYVFRLKSDKEGVSSCALFQSESQKWKIDCILRIKEYLLDKVGVPIIA